MDCPDRPILSYYFKQNASVVETIIRFFSFFTILTNLLVALCFTFLLTKSSSALRSFFYRKSTLTAVTVYILIVGLVYNLILRFYGNHKVCNLWWMNYCIRLSRYYVSFSGGKMKEQKILNGEIYFPFLSTLCCIF